MFIYYYYFGFISWLIVYNSFSVSVTSSGISAPLLRGVQAVGHSSPILRFSKLKLFCSSSDPESLEALSFLRLFVLRTNFTVFETRALISLHLSGCLLVPWNVTWPVPPPRAVDQVDFIALACSSMTLYEFISLLGPYRGHTGEFFLLFLLLASSSDGFAAWYDPLLCADLAGWWRSQDCLFFLVLVISFTLCLEYLLSSFDMLT